jgi:hypothetical protein
MDSEHWISRLAAAKRFYAAQLGHIDGAHALHLSCRAPPSLAVHLRRPALLCGDALLAFFLLLVLISGFLFGWMADMSGMGMEEVEMDMEDDGEMDMEMEMQLQEASARWPEVACPYCYEDYDLGSLCVHLDEDHPYEPHPAVRRTTPPFHSSLRSLIV